jgi:hypothetical protein
MRYAGDWGDDHIYLSKAIRAGVGISALAVLVAALGIYVAFGALYGVLDPSFAVDILAGAAVLALACADGLS